jgi:hypothetical protein
MKDPSLRSVSFAARGLWADMLCLMFEGGYKRGFMCYPNGSPINVLQLARMVGGVEAEIQPLLDELESTGVLSKTPEGIIYSRRMVRDEERRKLFSEAGKKGGGNPKLRGKRKPLNPALKGGFLTQPKGTPPPSASASTSLVNPLTPSEDDAACRQRLGKIFRMRGNWNDPAMVAYRKAQPLSKEDLDLVEWHYGIPNDDKQPLLKYRRRSLLVLLRNWADAVGKATQYAEGPGKWDWAEYQKAHSRNGNGHSTHLDSPFTQTPVGPLIAPEDSF